MTFQNDFLQNVFLQNGKLQNDLFKKAVFCKVYGMIKYRYKLRTDRNLLKIKTTRINDMDITLLTSNM